MEKSKFIIPYRWENRHVVLQNRVLFLPEYYDKYEEFCFPSWDSSELFGNTNPICIEYCSGNGQWILEKAREYPQYNWVAVEKCLARSKLIWHKMHALQQNNLMLVSGPAQQFTRYYVPSASVDQVFINFPDPWPKTKHAKHRLMQQDFAEHLQRILRPSGQLHFATDDVPYLQQALRILLACADLKPLQPEPFYSVNLTSYGQSYFEQLWKQQGRDRYFLQMIKSN